MCTVLSRFWWTSLSWSWLRLISVGETAPMQSFQVVMPVVPGSDYLGACGWYLWDGLLPAQKTLFRCPGPAVCLGIAGEPLAYLFRSMYRPWPQPTRAPITEGSPLYWSASHAPYVPRYHPCFGLTVGLPAPLSFKLLYRVFSLLSSQQLLHTKLLLCARESRQQPACPGSPGRDSSPLWGVKKNEMFSVWKQKNSPHWTTFLLSSLWKQGVVSCRALLGAHCESPAQML